MNKAAIQRFAIQARKDLIAQVSQRSYQYGITAESYGEINAVTIGGRALTSDQQRQRKELVEQIRCKGYTQVMEEVAYTWFNRLIALRFMEVNNYLPSHIRVFSDSTGAFRPEILNDVLHLDLPGLDTDKVAEFIENNQTEDLYRYLLLTQCNALNEALPQMFEKMGSYTELLLPNNILKQDSVIGRMVTEIPEEDWKDQVQIIGWLYQYYNSELKDETFALLKKNVKITKERIPSATQLFTPDWIVRYMVENSLGRLWLEGHPDDELRTDWKYYLDEAEQEAEVQKQLEAIRAECRNIKPQDIKVIDPCMGSGHILVYAFDVLVQIYKKHGVSERDAVQNILEYNLFGLDIDDRAAQLAYFAVMMKARQYDRRIFSRGIQPHMFAIQESNRLDGGTIDYFTNNDPKLKKDFGTLVDELRDAKEYGSILDITPVDFAALYARVEEVREEISLYREMVLNSILPLIQTAEVMAQKYDVVVTNPPYMGNSGMSGKLSEFVKKHYPDSKSDLFACFIEKGNRMTVQNGFNCMVTMQSWMFLSSFEKMRTQTLKSHDIVTLMHMENMVLGIAFGTAVTVFRNHYTRGYKGTYNQIKLCDIENGKPIEFPVAGNRFARVSTDNFSKIPGSPVAYWVSEKLIKAFGNTMLYNYSVSPSQNVTGNNGKYVRKHWELDSSKIGGKDSWIFYAKGGGYRKWWGNLDDIVNWTPNARKIYQYGDGIHASQIINQDYWYKQGITWGLITSSIPSFRVMPEGATFDKGGSTIIVESKVFYFTLALLNSKIYVVIAEILNPTLNFQVKDVRSIPLVLEHTKEISNTVMVCVELSKSDWDSYETSWDFKRHPLV